MEYQGFIKKLDVPPGHLVSERLTYEDVRVRAISHADLQEDVRGINASLEIIRRTRAGPWPTGEVTEEFDFVDWSGTRLSSGTGSRTAMPPTTPTTGIWGAATCIRWAGAPS